MDAFLLTFVALVCGWLIMFILDDFPPERPS